MPGHGWVLEVAAAGITLEAVAALAGTLTAGLTTSR